MKYTIIAAKDYNAETPNPVLRFKTDSGKDRSTGYVVKYDNGNVAWYANFGLARKKAIENPEGQPERTITPYDHNS